MLIAIPYNYHCSHRPIHLHCSLHGHKYDVITSNSFRDGAAQLINIIERNKIPASSIVLHHEMGRRIWISIINKTINKETLNCDIKYLIILNRSRTECRRYANRKCVIRDARKKRPLSLVAFFTRVHFHSVAMSRRGACIDKRECIIRPTSTHHSISPAKRSRPIRPSDPIT